MDKDIFDKKVKRLYFSGIGGISVSGLAHYFLDKNTEIIGSDIRKNDETEILENLGVKIFFSQKGENVKGADVFIYTSALSEDNSELKEARKMGIAVFQRSEVLGKIMDCYSNSVSVSGTHGKTTTTAMIARIFIESGLDPTVFLGGEDYSYGNFRKGESEYIVAEACEYKNNFRHIKSKVTVVTNIDNDHLDYYKNMENLIKAFKDYTENSVSVINADDKNSVRLVNSETVTFGIKNLASFMAKRIRKTAKGYSFALYENGIYKGIINLKIKGRYNIYNALSAICVARQFYLPFYMIKRGLENFSGVKRRNEYLGKINDREIFADYAHHPVEISNILSAYEENEKEEYMVIFQPHTYSRTRILMDDFVKVLKNEKNIAIYKTYPAREEYDALGSGKLLCENINKHRTEKSEYIKDNKSLETFIDAVDKKVKKILLIGAGDIYETAERMCEKNKQKNN